MIKLRTILLSKSFYLWLLLFAFLYVSVHVFVIKKDTKIEKKQTELYGEIKDISVNEDQVKIKIKVKKEYILGYIDKKSFIYDLNDSIKVTGILKAPNKNTVPNLFNYKKYLYNNNIFYLMEIENIKLISKNKNVFYKLKSNLIKRMDTYKSKAYLKLFVLGSKQNLDQEVYKTFQNNGISHLFCVSGMHVSLLTTMLLFLLKKIKVKETKRYIFIFLFLTLYLFLTNFSPSILRSVIFFILLSINKIYYFHIKTIYLLLVTLCICLFLNPYFIFHIGFLFSFTITFYLILFSKYLNTNSKIKNIVLVSFISFLAGLPICFYNFFSINILSIFYNLFFVPFISIFVFPLSLLTFVFKPLDFLLFSITQILENISFFIDKITIMKFSFYKPSLFIVLFYYGIITFCMYHFFNKRKLYFLFLIGILFLHYNYNFIFNSNYMIMIDVGQGDSVLLHAGSKNILVDTGGKLGTRNSYIAKNTVSLLQSLGIKKLNYLIITHGDYDHIGESSNIIKNFKVEKVLFNSNAYNKNEKNLIRLLKKKRIPYSKFKEGKSIHYKNLQMTSINKAFADENDSSLVLYVKINQHTILLTGDASVHSEEYYIKNYNIHPTILKLGHHGSKTATSEYLLDSIDPHLALISCGVDNKFKHPHEEVISRLDKYGISYLSTNKVGSVRIDFKRNVTIHTYPA